MSEISPEDQQSIERRLREFEHLYDQHPAWEEQISRRDFMNHIPHPQDIPHMNRRLRNVEPLHGAKVLYLDDGPQLFLRFVGYLTVATRRRVELLFYTGKTASEIADEMAERLQRCPQPHVLVMDQNLELLPDMRYAGHTENGHEVIDCLRYDLRRAGVPTILYSTDDRLSSVADSVGAGFVRKNIPPEAAVEQIAQIVDSYHKRIQMQRQQEERFITTD